MNNSSIQQTLQNLFQEFADNNNISLRDAASNYYILEVCLDYLSEADFKSKSHIFFQPLSNAELSLTNFANVINDCITSANEEITAEDPASYVININIRQHNSRSIVNSDDSFEIPFHSRMDRLVRKFNEYKDVYLKED
nr:MAG TPA: hypothetical protein [Caudoviricetes sp.]